MITKITSARPVKITHITLKKTTLTVKTSAPQQARVLTINVGRPGIGLDTYNADPLTFYTLAKS